MAVVPLQLAEPVAWFAPTYKLLAEPWREVRGVLGPLTRSSNATEHRIELINGGVIDMWSLDNPDAGRGRKYKRVIIDEAALVPNFEVAWTSSIRPTLTDLRGDAWFLSTPKGMNYFWQLYQMGRDPHMPEYASWQMPTSSNPYMSQDEIEAARLSLPERVFQQEYLALFLQDGAIFRGITDAATAQMQIKAEPGHEYVMGVDWGKYEDFSVFTVIDCTLRSMVYQERMNQIDYKQQVPRLLSVVDAFKPTDVVVEATGPGDIILEYLDDTNVPYIRFNTTHKSKQQIIENLQAGIEKGALQILNDSVLMAELQAFTATRTASGQLTYKAPDGYHDDCVMALAFAYSVARHDYKLQPTERTFLDSKW